MTTNLDFVGRKFELGCLQRLLDRRAASMVVVKGRRRIGKSRLIREFITPYPNCSFIGLPPEKNTTAQSQRDEFVRQFRAQFDLPPIVADDWGDIFTWLGKVTATGRIIIVLDEITWMGSQDPNFLGKLEIAWEKYFSTNPQLTLILCGSVSQWIEKNILSSTGYFGRVAWEMTLGQLPLQHCNQLLDKLGFKEPPHEKLTLLSLTGGIPWYIELFNPSLSINENIKMLCFQPDGLFTKEYKRLFHDLFGKKGDIYQKIVELIAIKPSQQKIISETLRYSSSGTLSQYLDELVTSGFLSRDFSWNFKTGKNSKISRYRLKDNYLRFYLKCIEPKLTEIEKGYFKQRALSSIPGLASIMGLQFENLILQNRREVWQALQINEEEVINDNPYLQHQTKAQQGCQIDYLIQTRFNVLYACEIKFSKNKIGVDVIEDIKQKLERLKIPQRFSIKPVLIHASDTTEELKEAHYFANIIDAADFFD